jgi:hypothetical protein
MWQKKNKTFTMTEMKKLGNEEIDVITRFLGLLRKAHRKYTRVGLLRRNWTCQILESITIYTTAKKNMRKVVKTVMLANNEP